MQVTDLVDVDEELASVIEEVHTDISTVSETVVFALLKSLLSQTEQFAYLDDAEIHSIGRQENQSETHMGQKEIVSGDAWIRAETQEGSYKTYEVEYEVYAGKEPNGGVTVYNPIEVTIVSK